MVRKCAPLFCAGATLGEVRLTASVGGNSGLPFERARGHALSAPGMDRATRGWLMPRERLKSPRRREYDMRPDLAACYGQERLPRYTELSDRAAFLRRDRPRYLCRMARRHSAKRLRLALSACPVLPVDVLVLRLPHLGGSPRRADRGLRSRRCAVRSIWCAQQIDSRLSGRPHPFRRRHADHHGARNVRRSDRVDPAFLLRPPLRRDRRSRSTRARLRDR